MLFDMLTVLWSTSARSDTMKNYRAYRSKLTMSKHSRLKHYGLTVIACAVAVALAGPLDAPSSCFLLAVIASSLFGGTGPGLLAVGLSAVAFNFLFLPSPLSLSSPSSHYLRFGVFVVAALATSQLVETKRRIEESRRLIDNETVRKQIAVETDLEKRLLPTFGDRVQLQQVIFNLLLNGIEAMEAVADRPKRLIIRSKMQSSNAILVEIRDYGTGVADST